MISGIGLHQSSTGWEFVSEAALEKFVWGNLQELLGLTPLKQQYISQGEISDILAIDDNGGLVILELKNAEDRYIVQQLTRYYANLLEEKPFADKINYERPVRLVAIAPNFHRHNLIDKQHSSLQFEFLQFSITQESDDLFFILKDIEAGTLYKHFIPNQVINLPEVDNVPEPPDLLLKWLGSCSAEEQLGLLKVRSVLLSCSPKMKEMVDKRIIQYGSGKTRLCAEICFQQKSQKPVLFLWLPTPGTIRFPEYKKLVIGRLRIWTDGQTISHVGHVPEGWGKMKSQAEWDQLPPEKRPSGLRWSLSSKSQLPTEVEGYLHLPKDAEKPDYWEVLSKLAAEKWLGKI